jgi:oligopeptide transport system substrate-binding protein
MRMNRRILAAVALTFLTLLSCTKKGLEYGLDVKETLVVNLQVEPPSLDWSIATDTTSAWILYNVMEGLVEYNLKDPELNVVPALATEWKASQGGRVWTFTLRKGVKWTDGVEFTGQNVVDGWERLLRPTTAAEYAYFLFPVKNARAYNSGKIKDFKEVGVHINEKGALVVELEQPMAYFPMLLTHHSTYPQRKDVFDKWGDKWTNPEHFVTLGAYKVKIWEHDKNLVMERNDSYYGDKAKTKYVLGRMINEFSTALNLYEHGRLDFQQEMPDKELPAWRSKPGYRENASLLSYFYGFNIRKPPFNNLKVRKAFVHAVDRKQITDLLAAGYAPLTGWIPAGMFGYENERGLKFDPQLAGKLLDEAGYKDRSKFPRVTLSFNTNENHQRIAEAVQAQLKKNLGVEIQVQNEEWKVYLARLKTKTDVPDIYRLGWLADYPDPSNFADLMTSYSDNNHTGWGNKKYDDMVAEAARTLDHDKRRKLYSELQQLLTEEDVPVLPIYSGVYHVLLSSRVENFPLSSLQRWVFKGVTLK